MNVRSWAGSVLNLTDSCRSDPTDHVGRARVGSSLEAEHRGPNVADALICCRPAVRVHGLWPVDSRCGAVAFGGRYTAGRSYVVDGRPHRGHAERWFQWTSLANPAKIWSAMELLLKRIVYRHTLRSARVSATAVQDGLLPQCSNRLSVDLCVWTMLGISIRREQIQP